MKKISTLFLSLAVGFIAMAQNPTGKIVLTKNQQLKFVTTTKGNISQDMMGQTMETIMDVANFKTITVKDVSEQNYKIEAVTTRIKMNMSLMGQDKTFDSDNKDDLTGDMKALGKDINKINPLELSADGKCKGTEKVSPEKSEEEANPINGMMQQMMGGGTEEITVAACFMLIPQGKKIGDSWTDTLGAGTTKTVWNYTWDSTIANIAVIKVTAKETSISSVNALGMDITINLTNDITEVRKLELTIGVITKCYSNKKINGTMDIMGQSVPMTGIITTTFEVD